MTLEEIGEEMGITRERVRQLRNRALKKMRTHGSLHLRVYQECG
jgi:DNA-directed RNA polymerase sigma subunit (sigma70/sigma32)